jgi:DNA-binding NtrC family response regulator
MAMAKILLIDDDADLRQFLQDALEQRGHEIWCLERAEDGAAVLAKGEFDLVLVDEHMPGLSGSEFLNVLRKKGLGIPAILMTGRAKGTLIQPMKELDAFVVGKPAGGNDEFWKELEPVLDVALQGEAEIRASVGRAVNVALKAGKTNLVPYLRRLLDRDLLTQALAEANGNPEEAARILGVPLAQLMEEKPPKASALSFQTEALLLIANHPELTVDEIAERLGCSRSKLYRDLYLTRAIKGRKSGNYRPPRGHKTADGDVEAFDDD